MSKTARWARFLRMMEAIFVGRGGESLPALAASPGHGGGVCEHPVREAGAPRITAMQPVTNRLTIHPIRSTYSGHAKRSANASYMSATRQIVGRVS